ncbi:MAG: invasion associated locus B family protein [Hyphomicrobiaceae bacterium]
MAVQDMTRGVLRTVAGAAAACLVLAAAHSGSARAEDAAKSAWTKICEEVEVDKDKKAKMCLTTQERFDPKTGALAVSIAIRSIEGQPAKSLLITLPLGMAIPAGMQMRVDDQAEPTKLAYGFCMAEGCTAEMEATPDILKRLGAGKMLKVAGINLFADQTVFEIDLTGFSAADKSEGGDARVYRQKRAAFVGGLRAKYIEELQKKAAEGGAAAGSGEAGAN